VRVSVVSGSPHGLAPGLVRGFQRFTSQKSVSRPMGWSRLAISFWCDGLDRERLDRRRTASVTAAIAMDECGQVCV
jgi:hypothetical protein